MDAIVALLDAAFRCSLFCMDALLATGSSSEVLDVRNRGLGGDCTGMLVFTGQCNFGPRLLAARLCL